MDTAITIPTLSNLTQQQEDFCHYLLADPEMDRAEAYLKVSPDVTKESAYSMGSKWLAKPEVKQFLETLFIERQKRLQINEDWVILRLRDIHDKCMQAVPVHSGDKFEIDDEGNMVEKEPSYYKFDANGALKALELMGKHLRMFSDKVDVSQLKVDIDINFGADSEKEPIDGKFTRVGSN